MVSYENSRSHFFLASLVCIPADISVSAAGLKICEIASRIKCVLSQ